TGEKLAEHQNSMWYDADLAERLRSRGVLKTVNRVENIGQVKFANNIDLTKTKSITLKPSQFGIDHIRDVRIVPTFLKEGRDIGVRFVEDGTVEVTVLNEAALLRGVPPHPAGVHQRPGAPLPRRDAPESGLADASRHHHELGGGHDGGDDLLRVRRGGASRHHPAPGQPPDHRLPVSGGAP